MPRKIREATGLRVRGLSVKAIATRLEVSPRTIVGYLSKARRKYGWTDVDTLADVAAPLAVDNVVKHLAHEGSELGVQQGANTMTLKTLQGLGVFKTHSAVKQETKTEQTRVLRVEIALPELPPDAALPEGTIFANPRRARLS